MSQPKFAPKISREDFYMGRFPDEVKDDPDGSVIIPTENNRGHWTYYLDGSGSFTSPHGNIFFQFDMPTHEINKFGQYEQEDFQKGWLDKYENLYSREYEPAEKTAMAMLKQRIAPAYGIMADALPRQAIRDADYFAVNETTAVPAERFRQIQAGMETACDLNGRDRCVRTKETGEILKRALEQEQTHQGMVTFEFEHRHFALDSNIFVDIQSIPVFVPYSKRQHTNPNIESEQEYEAEY